MYDDEVTEFESRLYQNPQTSLDERGQFIENLRSVVPQNNAQIYNQTYNLGTRVPSSLGGLGGGSANYFAERMQTPSVNATVADLQAKSQAQALQTVLSNDAAARQKRYQDAYRNYQKRAASGGGTADGGNGKEGKAEQISTEDALGSNVLEEGLSKAQRLAAGVSEIPEMIRNLKAPASSTTAVGATDPVRSTTGDAVPTSTSTGYYAVGANGIRMPFSIVQGEGVVTPTASYNKSGGKQYLSGLAASGVKFYAANGRELNPSMMMLSGGLY